MDIGKDVSDDLQKIREQSPLIHNITNYVVMNTTANAILSIGASPVMAHAIDEVEEMVRIAQALVINVGTLSRHWIDAMYRAADAAEKKGIPWILDPVGAGATSLRTQTVLELIDRTPPSIIRGNASEIMSVAQARGGTKGVDSSHSSEMAIEAAKKLSHSSGSVVCVSGAVDIVIGKNQMARVMNGHPLMPKVTGLGCTASALIGVFAAVNNQPFPATYHAMAVMGIAGEIAAQRAEGPGTLQLYFLDTLYRLSESDIKSMIHLEFE
jgi:hydroxyethylthiazole kinase